MTTPHSPFANSERELTHEEIVDEINLIRKMDAEDYMLAEARAQDAEFEMEAYDEKATEFWTERASAYFPAISGHDLHTEPEIPERPIIDSFIYAGCVNGLVGPPKAGKSTLLYAMILALVEGRPWNDKPTSLPGSILYITEQSKRSLKAQLSRLPDKARERILMAKRPDGHPVLYLMHPEHHLSTKLVTNGREETDWQRNLRLWTDAIKNPRINPAVVIIDTFGRYACLSEGGENDNALIGSRIADLQQLIIAKESLAVMLLSHANKSGSQSGHNYLSLINIRGGSAYAGGLDHVCMINRPQKQGHITNTCYMTVESRLVDSSQFTLTRSDNGTYVRAEAESEDVNPHWKEMDKLCQSEPGLEDLSVRKFKDALRERGLEVTHWQAQKYKRKSQF
jgi:RecA-family ATPase